MGGLRLLGDAEKSAAAVEFVIGSSGLRVSDRTRPLTYALH